MSVEQIIQTKRIHVLFLLPFILAGIVAGYHYFGPPPRACHEEGVIALPFIARFHASPWLLWLGSLWLLLLSYLLFFIADRHEVLTRTTTLPALIYLLLSAGIFCHHGVNAYMVAAAMIALALNRLQLFITRLNSNAPVFDFGSLIVLAVLLCPKLVLLIPWAILVLPFSGRATFKDVMALLLGFLAALLLVAGYFFLVNEWHELPGRFLDTLLAGERKGYHLDPRQRVAIGLLTGLALVSMLHALTRTAPDIVSRRRGLLATISLLLFLGSTPFFIPLDCQAFLFVPFVPLSYLYARYFVSYRSKWSGRALFLVLLVACLLLIL
ncbi:MAG: hypothetical protein LBP56_08110 [Odoribacteraceae bacterium]|jgi:hypothetical protein|nr:hypothetical protein [Odoribacteraceae bacterium]